MYPDVATAKVVITECTFFVAIERSGRGRKTPCRGLVFFDLGIGLRCSDSLSRRSNIQLARS